MQEALSRPLPRRDFLKLLGPGLYIIASADALLVGQPFSRPRGYPEDFNAYLRIAEDGAVTCFAGKVELGQGVVTSLAQLLAEELEVPFSSVKMVLGDTALCPWDSGTNGSRSIKIFGPVLRAAGAEAREVLILLAAEHLKAPAEWGWRGRPRGHHRTARRRCRPEWPCPRVRHGGDRGAGWDAP